MSETPWVDPKASEDERIDHLATEKVRKFVSTFSEELGSQISTMGTVEDRLLITIDVSLDGNDADDTWPRGFERCMAADEDAVGYLRDIATAIEDARLFGWMMQEIAGCSYAAGEWPPPPSVEKKMTAEPEFGEPYRGSDGTIGIPVLSGGILTSAVLARLQKMVVTAKDAG